MQVRARDVKEGDMIYTATGAQVHSENRNPKPGLFSRLMDLVSLNSRLSRVIKNKNIPKP